MKNIRNLIRDVVNKSPEQWHQNAKKALDSFALKGLLLVPICSVLLLRPPPSKLGVNQTLAYMRLLVSKWNEIITAGLTKVKDEMLKLESLEANHKLVSELEVLLDDNAVAKPGNGKRRKKKNRKSRKKVRGL